MSGELSRPSYCTGYHSRPLYCSNTGSIALRLAEVQPPKTVATLSTVMSCFAFSAKVGQSEAPSSLREVSVRLPFGLRRNARIQARGPQAPGGGHGADVNGGMFRPRFGFVTGR